MHNETIKAGRAIAAQLGTSETSIDHSLIAGANLLISICDGSLRTGAAAETASEAVARVVSGLAALRDARESFVACHQALTIVRDEGGLSGSDLGCTFNKRTVRTARAAKPALAAVA
ncbi:MAG: hypothetical protein EOP60_10350 [Sphingomonadales bacterium]|nr:MAG: hypothetical protein EOP60_10350 [Sphingomonadales bacterium]